MAQERFGSSLLADESIPCDFESDEAALAYANSQLDKFVEAMRYSLERQIVGWPAEDRALNTQEAIRHLFRNISLAHASYMEADWLNPELTRLGATSRIQFQLPAVDCVYHTALLHGDYTYRLQGYRGTAAVFQITAYRGNACELVNWKTWSVANNFDTPALAPGKVIDVVLSRSKPENLGDAYWMELPEGPCEVHLRQYYGNWETEEAASLRIVRENQTFPAAMLTKELAEARFKRVANFLRVHADFCSRGVQAHLDADPHEVPELVVPGAFEGTQYFNGHFRCQPDQAVILEAEDAGSLYWNLELANLQWEPGDWWTRLSSYNGTQIHRYPDGRIRLVASWQDTGVPNWLDCSGRILHLFSFRFFRAKQTPMQPRVKIVPLTEVRNHLPPCPVIAPEARYDLLTRRYLSVYRRRCSDF
jgi:hypothetical protein